MVHEFKLPEVGEGIDSGQVVKVSVQAGDAVQAGQTLLELETGKATIEIPAPENGTIAEVLIKDGETVQVGQILFKITTGEAAESLTEGPEKEKPEGSPAPQPQADKPTAASPQPAPQKGPAGDKDTPAPADQPSAESKADAGKQEQPPEPPRPAAAKTPSPPPQKDAPAAPSAAHSDVPASPSTRRLAHEIGVDITQVTGSGPNGRVTEDDVKAHAKARLSAPAGSGPSAGQPPLPDFSKWGPVERVGMSAIRRQTAQHLARSWSTIPHVTHFEKADITRLEDLRRRYSKPEAKLTITPFLIKVITAALKHFPQFNASLDLTRQEIVYKKHYHIGVAVDTPHGLLVPVVRDADQKGILALAQELGGLAEQARAKKLTPEQMQGGTFTLTNLGGIGGTGFTPIINWPEAAILGVARARMEPNYQSDRQACVPSLMLPLCLSYDHRLIDGADGARFLRWVAEAIEDPFVLELEN